MKINLYAFAMCQSMFCAIPFPGNLWEERARGRMLLFLPLVGVEIGAIWAGVTWLCRALSLPSPVAGLVVALCPYILTGGIHLDGFMDVTDAVHSWRDASRRREILKDSHVGSFAVIGVAMLLLAQFALCASGETGEPLGLLLIPAISRCGSALAVTALPPMSTSQYAAQEKPGKYIWILLGQMALALAGGFALGMRCGLALVGCLAGYALALRRAYRSLEGMNGDVAGYALTIGELCGLAVWALL